MISRTLSSQDLEHLRCFRGLRGGRLFINVSPSQLMVQKRARIFNLQPSRPHYLPLPFGYCWSARGCQRQFPHGNRALLHLPLAGVMPRFQQSGVWGLICHCHLGLCFYPQHRFKVDCMVCTLSRIFCNARTLFLERAFLFRDAVAHGPETTVFASSWVPSRRTKLESRKLAFIRVQTVIHFCHSSDLAATTCVPLGAVCRV